MIGFFIGTVCLIGLLATLRRGAHGCGHGYGGYRRYRGFGGYGGHGGGHCGHQYGHDRGDDEGFGGGSFREHDGPPDPWARRDGRFDGSEERFGPPPFRGFGGGGRFGFGKRWFLRGLFERLHTTPEQERTIVDALEEASEQRSRIRQEMRASRKDIARAIRGESVEETVLGEVFSRHDNVLEEVRKATVAALVKIHAVLDDKQRARLGEIVEGGWFARF